MEAFLFYPAKRQDLRGKQILSVGEKYYLADHGIREFGAYAGSRDNFPRYVVSMDEIPMGRDGIRHCHIRDFLLAPA